MKNLNTIICEYKVNRNEELFNQILKSTEKTIYDIAKKYRGCDNIEDLFQIGVIGLLQAIETFDITKEIKFNTYAYRCISNEILMSLRKNKKHNSVVNDKDGNLLYTIESTSERLRGTKEELTIADILVADDNIEEEVVESEKSEFLSKCIEDFGKKNEKKAQVIKLILKDMRQEDIAEIVGCNRSYISRIQKSFVEYAQKEKDRVYVA